MMTGSSPTPRADALVRDTEFTYTARDFRHIAEILHEECGIALGDNKANLVYSRLAKRLRAIGLKSFRDYCLFISEPEGLDERKAMIAAMTTNVTRFFREPHHFNNLRTVVLPRLEKTARAGGRVRIWSAGCSSGEEPFSIAMTVLDVIPDANNLDIRILATDLDQNMIAHARAAVYQGSVVESIPKHLLTSWAQKKVSEGETTYRMADKVRSLIRFNELNLLGPWPMTGGFDVIFCRNVMIYFDEDTQLKLCRRFSELLPPGGTLYIGHSERIDEDRLPLDLVGQTIYIKKGGSA
jgi:chemotaxis protein methyltransferase CheR